MKPKIGPRQVVYENKYQQIYSVKVEFDRFEKEIFVNDVGGRVGVVITRGSDILLVRQYRLLINGMALEIPGGKVDSNETPEAAAAREALEETCMRCTNLKPLLYFHPGLDTCDNPTFMFVAEKFEETPEKNLHQHEVSDRVWIPLEECMRMIFARKIVDSLTVAALLAYHIQKHNPELFPKSNE
jgi:8-oxo-dGDP phosphatase